MKNLAIKKHTSSQWESGIFMAAGSFMLINVALLWIRHFSGYQLSILWPAIPAMTALALSVFGLLKLYPRASVQAPGLAKTGAAFALAASMSLGVAVIWIFAVTVFGEGMPQPAPQALLALIAIFMIAMVLAFLTNAVVFMGDAQSRKVGYMLSLPVSMWGIMLVVGMVRGMEVGLSLDFYTNAVISAAFLGLGFYLKASRGSDI